MVSGGKQGIKIETRKFRKRVFQLCYHTITRFEIVTPHYVRTFFLEVFICSANYYLIIPYQDAFLITSLILLFSPNQNPVFSNYFVKQINHLA